VYDVNKLFQILSDTTPAPPDQIPITGWGTEVEQKMSSIFVQPHLWRDNMFGTRSQHVLIIDNDNNLLYQDKLLHPDTDEWKSTTFKFCVQ